MIGPLAKPYTLVIFQGGGGGPEPLSPTGSAHGEAMQMLIYFCKQRRPRSNAANQNLYFLLRSNWSSGWEKHHHVNSCLRPLKICDGQSYPILNYPSEFKGLGTRIPHYSVGSAKCMTKGEDLPRCYGCLGIWETALQVGDPGLSDQRLPVTQRSSSDKAYISPSWHDYKT